jgi:hypothetical protein
VGIPVDNAPGAEPQEKTEEKLHSYDFSISLTKRRLSINVDKIQRAHMLKFLQENKDVFSVSGIEKRIGCPKDTLQKAMQGKQSLPRKWEKSLEDWFQEMNLSYDRNLENPPMGERILGDLIKVKKDRKLVIENHPFKVGDTLLVFMRDREVWIKDTNSFDLLKFFGVTVSYTVEVEKIE